MEQVFTYVGEAISSATGSFGPFGALIAFLVALATSLRQIWKLIMGTKGFGANVPDHGDMFRGFWALAFIGLLVLVWFENRTGGHSLDLPFIGVCCVVAAVLGALIFYTYGQSLIHETDNWKEKPRVVGGVFLRRNAAEYKKKHGYSIGRIIASMPGGNSATGIRNTWSPLSLSMSWSVIFLSLGALNIGLPGAVIAFSMDMFDVRVEQEETADEKTIRLPSNFVFATDSAELAVMSDLVLQWEMRNIVDYGPARIEVHGHADGSGDDDYNQKLSEERAETVRVWLSEQPDLDGIDITGKGFGETQFRFEEEGLTGAALRKARRGNRRVELILFKE